MLIPGQTLPLTIEKPAVGGRMIARANGQVVLVSGAIPGERVHARIERVAKGVAYAETVGVDDPSPDRRTDVRDPLCGGCLYTHIAYPRQLEIKSLVIADAFQRIGRLPLQSPVRVAASPEEGYRMRARLHVRGGRIGFFREGTHDLCEARQTRQLLPSTCDAIDTLAAAIRNDTIDGIRELELSENVDASERAVFVDAVPEIRANLLERLAGVGGFSGMLGSSGSFGSPHVVESLAIGEGKSLRLRRHVLSFFQGNRHLLADFVAHVVAQVPEHGDVLDLYAGVGLFAVAAAAARQARVTAVEGDRFSAADLAANAAAADDAVATVHESVELFVASAAGVRAPTVIVDPPRTGMSREAIHGVLRLNAPRLIYVSCDLATLARDARRSIDAGYTIDRIDAFDMFPNTPHVETVVVFTRR